MNYAYYICHTMHEMGVTQSILDIVIRTANQHNATKVEKIYLVIGELSSYIDESVQFIFNFLSKGTCAEKAQLIIKNIPANASCGSCGNSFKQKKPLQHECPSCGSCMLTVTGGDEFYIESIEVDDESTDYKRNSERQQ